VLARITQMRLEAEGVLSLTLRPAAGEPLPAWTPGAHIDLHLAPGLVRQYSLCGDPSERDAYRVAVLREPAGRGGSARVHDVLRVGDAIEISEPRNHFELVDAPGYVFVAGGIGITPILPMLAEVKRRGQPWRLFYGGRRRASMAFADELDGAVGLLPEDEHGLLPLAAIVAEAHAAGAALYCCGPGALLDAIEAECERAGCLDRLRVERFSPADRGKLPDEADRAFTVVLARSGTEFVVAAGQSVLHRLLDEGVDVGFSCEEGTCGSCETRVVAGRPCHRDSVLTAAEQAAGDRMMICVSRSLDARLVLDL
jgi:ferredoxin-NADP reductase